MSQAPLPPPPAPKGLKNVILDHPMAAILSALLAVVIIGAIWQAAFPPDPAAEPDNDGIEGRSCEIFFDISSDAADNVDTLDETRERFKDLLDGYGVSLPSHMQSALRDIVSALTTGDTTALEGAVARMTSACT